MTIGMTGIRQHFFNVLALSLGIAHVASSTSNSFCQDLHNVIQPGKMRQAEFVMNGILSLDDRGTVRSWDKSLSKIESIGAIKAYSRISVSPSGERIVLFTKATGTFFSVKDKRQISIIDANIGVYSPDGNVFAVGRGSEAKLLDANTGRSVWRIPDVHGFVYALSFSPRGDLLAVSGDESITVWDVKNRKVKQKLPKHDGFLTSAFTAKGELLATGGDDEVVRIWEVNSGKLKYLLRAHLGSIYSLVFSPDGTQLATGSTKSKVHIWSTTNFDLLQTLGGEYSGISSLSYSLDGQKILGATPDGLILFDIGKWSKKRH